MIKIRLNLNKHLPSMLMMLPVLWIMKIGCKGSQPGIRPIVLRKQVRRIRWMMIKFPMIWAPSLWTSPNSQPLLAHYQHRKQQAQEISSASKTKRGQSHNKMRGEAKELWRILIRSMSCIRRRISDIRSTRRTALWGSGPSRIHRTSIANSIWWNRIEIKWIWRSRCKPSCCSRTNRQRHRESRDNIYPPSLSEKAAPRVAALAEALLAANLP